MPREASTVARRERLMCSGALVLAGVAVIVGAWREAVHHDGSLWIAAPAGLLPAVAIRARRATRCRSP